uniref:Cyclic AMP receptor protein n=1 Tax=Escherichia coli TaxID=562 RepID=Q47650_ECOLX|nr:cyclic AMP receptor protein (CRP) [Escherichia coli]
MCRSAQNRFYRHERLWLRISAHLSPILHE